MVRAHHQSKGHPRKKILIPDSAHGTNPATAAMVGYSVENLKSNARGMVDVEALEAQMNEDVAALMLTNPNTLGVFEQEIHKIADILHAKGGAALHGRREHECAGGQGAARGFWRGRDASEPAQDIFDSAWRRRAGLGAGGDQEGAGAVSAEARGDHQGGWHSGFEYDRPQSVGRVRAFYGNFGMFVRALAYILANGPDGLRQTTEDAVLNANYIRKGLEGVYDLPYSTPSMHEVVFSDKLQAKKGVKTMDIAKRLIDYGFHPYTTAFPLIVPGALMIEPTESEPKEELDLFIEAMRSIAEEVEEDPETVLSAPHSTRVSRLDETAAARKPVLRWKPQS